MADRYPGYDVLAKRWTPSWNQTTRAVIDERLNIRRTPRFFTAEEWRTLGAVCERIMPQPKDRPAVPLPAYVDGKMADNRLDGYRYAQLPPQGEAWRCGLAAFDREALGERGFRFDQLPGSGQDALLGQAQRGELKSEAWRGMPCDLFFKHRIIPDITHAYYGHPTAWNEIGFGGPASPRGYVRMALNRRDPWEAAEATPGYEAAARRKNERVG